MSDSSPCPSQQTLLDFFAGKLAGDVAETVRKHLGECDSCRRLAASQVEASPDSKAATVPQPAAGTVADEKNLPDESESSLDLNFLKPATDPKAMGRLGDYDVQAVLGQGAMGVVFKAFDPHLCRSVAVKVLSPPLAASPKAHRRFLREARAAAGINHPNVVTIHAVEEQAGLPYLVMEYVTGRRSGSACVKGHRST
jgi:hypothetical protein